jgi:hypothetical protein
MIFMLFWSIFSELLIKKATFFIIFKNSIPEGFRRFLKDLEGSLKLIFSYNFVLVIVTLRAKKTQIWPMFGILLSSYRLIHKFCLCIHFNITILEPISDFEFNQIENSPKLASLIQILFFLFWQFKNIPFQKKS